MILEKVEVDGTLGDSYSFLGNVAGATVVACAAALAAALRSRIEKGNK